MGLFLIENRILPEMEMGHQIPELGTSVYIIPAEEVKNREKRLVVLNEVAEAGVDEIRGVHPDRIYTYRGRPTIKGQDWF